MSNQSWPVGPVYVVEITRENLEKFKISPHIINTFIEAMEDIGAYQFFQDLEEYEVFDELSEEFERTWGIAPQFLCLDDDSEGLTGELEIYTPYLMFETEDKYEMIVKPRWKSLPIEPTEGSFSVWC